MARMRAAVGAVLALVHLLYGGEAMATSSGWVDAAREATVALGTRRLAKVLQKDGSTVEKEIFGVVGTGVILAVPDDEGKVPWLVTAKHVFRDPDTGFEPDSLQLRFAWFDQRSVDDYLGIAIPLKKEGKPLWSAHPTPEVDLAAIPLAVSKADAGRDSIDPIPLGNFATADDIFEGASVLVFGYPGAVGPSFQSRAVVRSGVIAWTSPERPAEQPLLIDAMVFPGNSGGPVFKVPTGTNREGGFVLGGKVSFLGIVSQGRKEAVPLMAGGKQIELQGPAGAVKVVSENWIGIGVVEPASRVLDLLKAAKANQAHN